MTARPSSTGRSGRPLIFGEVLFDCFPDQQAVLGGAPFNVAWHLQGFGAEPLLISRIGRDARGEQVRTTMLEWGMDIQALQVDDTRPTGVVQIVLQNGGHSFDILPEQAYDRIDAAAALQAAGSVMPALLYYGSLITRTPEAEAALQAVRKAVAAPAFVDINLRAPWWNQTRIETLMRGARWLKLNDEELRTLTHSDSQDEQAQAQRLRAELGLELLILTRGAGGASYYGDQQVNGTPPPIKQQIDTVGAGDAFSAVTILGLLKGWPLAETLDRALQFAARICAQRGATAADPVLYKSFREAWSL